MRVFHRLSRPVALAAAVAAGSLAIDTGPAAACTSDDYIGTVCIVAGLFCPQGYLELNGQILSVKGNEILFSLMGSTYGGDGRTNFALPDMRGRSPIGIGQGPGLLNVGQGDRRGAEQIRIGVNNLPSHNHPAYVDLGDGSISATNGAWIANPVGTPAKGDDIVSKAFVPNASGDTVAELNNNTIGAAGKSEPITFFPPQLGIRFCIATVGGYPPRPQ